MTENTSAGTVEPEIVIAESSGVVTTIERFAVPPDERGDAVRKAAGRVARVWKSDPTFVGAVLLRSRSEGGVAKYIKRGGVSCYAQWKGSAGGEGELPSPRSLREALPGHQVLNSRAYTVEFTGQAGPGGPPTRVSVRGTPYAHFGLFGVTRENQDVLLDRARESAPKSLGSPGLIAIDFHRSTDGLHVVNLGVWSTLDEFEALLDRPGFKDRDEYYKDIAEFEPDFFDVVAVEVGSTG